MQASQMHTLPSAVTGVGSQRGYSFHVGVLRQCVEAPKISCASSLICLCNLDLTVLRHDKVSLLHLKCITVFFFFQGIFWHAFLLIGHVIRAGTWTAHFIFPGHIRLLGMYQVVVETGEGMVLKQCGWENFICLANVSFKQVWISMIVLGCVSTMPWCHPVLYHVTSYYVNVFI